MKFDPNDTPHADDLSSEDERELINEHDVEPSNIDSTVLDGDTPIGAVGQINIPTRATTEGRYWITERSFRSYDTYMNRHEILYPDETSEDHLPPTDYESIRELDREALEAQSFGGKWNVFLPESEVDEVWEDVKSLVRDDVVHRAKVATEWSREELDREDYVIVVYTMNYFDRDDVFRIRDALREQCAIDETIYYKPTLWTRKNIYASTLDQFDVPRASRYSG